MAKERGKGTVLFYLDTHENDSRTEYEQRRPAMDHGDHDGNWIIIEQRLDPTVFYYIAPESALAARLLDLVMDRPDLTRDDVTVRNLMSHDLLRLTQTELETIPIAVVDRLKAEAERFKRIE